MNKKFIETIDFSNWEIETDTGFQDIKYLHKTIPYIIYNIITYNGLRLKCADNHILFDNNYKEIYVKHLHIGDEIITKYGIDKIIYINRSEISENMYDFELADDTNHRYYTNGILSHNTEIARSIAKMLNVPMAIADATSLTQSGYVGEDVESIITRVLQNCDYDVEKAEHAIIVLDECDKLAKTSNNRSITRDVSGEGVQQGLLKMLEGNQVLVPPQGGRKHPEQKLIKVDTTNILFILSGAFVGLDEIIRERLEDEQQQKSSSTQSIGFSACTNNYNKEDEISDEDIMQYVQPDDITHFGMIPEIVGRLPVITYTNPLDKESLKHILTQPVNALVKQYKKLFLYYNIQLEFTNNAIDRIAEYAEQLNTGARSLRTCMERLMQDYMFNGPDLGKDYNKDNLFILKITKKDVDRELAGFINIDNKNNSKNNNKNNKINS